MAAHGLTLTVLNATEDLDAARVQIAAVPAQSVAAAARNVAAADRSAVADRFAVGDRGAVGDRYAVADRCAVAGRFAAGDRCAVAVHNARVFPDAARALSGKGLAHRCAQVDPVVGAGVSVRSGGSGRPDRSPRSESTGCWFLSGRAGRSFRSGRSVLSGRAGRSVGVSISASVGLVGAVGSRRSRGADSLMFGVSESTGRSCCGKVRAGRSAPLLSFASRPPVV